ncbi:MAG: alpha/beta fold hydrolase [Ilumatobacteraceae bacterium]
MIRNGGVPESKPEGDASNAEAASSSALGLGGATFVGLDGRQVLAALGRYGRSLVRNPAAIAARAVELVAEDVRIIAGTSRRSPEPKDRRFSDEAWQRRGWKQLAQGYLAWRDVTVSSVDGLGMDDASADRARFALMQVTEAVAPTNNLLTNPAATRTAVRTRGRSLVDGVRHLSWDLRHNGGLPSQVDTRPFVLGENTAATAGAVVRRTDLFELIQFEPRTDKVRERPVVVIPPQINRYYFLDLAPGRSFVEHAVDHGQQVFILSWRNPGPEHRSWSLDSYVSACLDACEAARAITGADAVNVIGFCSGGLTQSVLLGYLAAQHRPLVHAAALGVTMLDSEVKSVLNSFATRRSVQSTINRSRKNGVLEGRQLARTFAWVRPNDLIWNYWVSNYLMGERPPAFDVLAWNADTTNLPNTLHEQFLEMALGNSLMEPGGMSVLGIPIDLGKVEVDMYSVGAINDHLVPWEAAYSATQLFGGDHRFVLSNSGHVQALVNPPGNAKASYYVNDDHPEDPATWLEQADKMAGSWWTDWAEWIDARSGAQRDPAETLGSRDNPVLCRAPGTYVSS